MRQTHCSLTDIFKPGLKNENNLLCEMLNQISLISKADKLKRTTVCGPWADTLFACSLQAEFKC